MPGEVGVVRVPKNLAVDLQIGAEFSLLPPQSRLAESAIFRIEVFVPQLSRFHDVAVSVENRKALRRCHLFFYFIEARDMHYRGPSWGHTGSSILKQPSLSSSI